MHENEKWKWSRSTASESLQPHGLQPTRLLCPRDPPGKSAGVGCHCLLHTWHLGKDKTMESKKISVCEVFGYRGWGMNSWSTGEFLGWWKVCVGCIQDTKLYMYVWKCIEIYSKRRKAYCLKKRKKKISGFQDGMKNHEIIDLYCKYLKQFHLRKLVQTHVTLEMNSL